MKKINGTILKDSQGMVLAGVIVLMIIAGVFIAAMSAIVFTSSASQNNVIQGTQALAIAQAGSEWYFETLRTDADWTDEAGAEMNFANGTFSIQLLSIGPQEIRFRSTGRVTSILTGHIFRRFEEWTVRKLPTAFKFVVFHGDNLGSNNFRIVSNGSKSSSIAGSVWSQSTVRVDAGNKVTHGKVFVPPSKDVTGPGTYVKKQMTSPYPVMPVLAPEVYTDVMDSFDELLDENDSSDDLVLEDESFTVNGVMNFRNFRTQGAVTIKGSGTVVVDRDLLLNGSDGLTADDDLKINVDSGGTIQFITNRNLTIGSNNADTSVSDCENCIFYSRASASNNNAITVRGANVSISDAKFLARRRVLVREGAKIYGNSSIFIDRTASGNNYVEIRGDSSMTLFNGNILSISDQSPSIRINNGGPNKVNVRVQGFVFAGPPGGTGVCQLTDALVIGSVVCSRYDSNRITNSVVQHGDFSEIPAGFENVISKQDNSWEGY